MNYSKILDELNKASLFELYRLEQAIRRSLEDPVRIKNIKDSLKVGHDIEYFDAEENRLVEASIIELKRTRALVENRHDGKLWNIPFYHINLDHGYFRRLAPINVVSFPYLLRKRPAGDEQSRTRHTI